MSRRPDYDQRNWSINGRFLGRSLTGVDRYALEILNAMRDLIRNEHPLTRNLSIEVLCPVGATKSHYEVDFPVRHIPSAPGHIWEQMILPRHVRGGLLSLCNSGPIALKKQIVCIHDLNTRLVPESYGLAFRLIYRLLMPTLARRVQRVVTVSDFSRRTMSEFALAPRQQIRVIHDGHEHVLDWHADRSALNSVKMPDLYVLMVGSKAPHKNNAVIYSIATELAEKGIHILVTGGQDKNVFAGGDEPLIPENVKQLGRVGDDDLAYLYEHALCLVFPSKMEGFGLPALEAMAVGCPVISTSAASLPEVCADAVLYANPNISSEWLTAITRVAHESALRLKLFEAGKRRSASFSWRAGAQKYLELMYDCDVHGK